MSASYVAPEKRSLIGGRTEHERIRYSDIVVPSYMSATYVAPEKRGHIGLEVSEGTDAFDVSD